MAVAAERGYGSIAFPLIGAGSGGGKADRVLAWMTDELQEVTFDGTVLVVRYKPAAP
jgi:O-acetyl-ADP-ribose deacetylase (regulator of RNase III)